jgi:hypothetical protein
MSKELKTKLLQQCKDTVGNDLGGRRPLNIAVIGPPIARQSLTNITTKQLYGL